MKLEILRRLAAANVEITDTMTSQQAIDIIRHPFPNNNVVIGELLDHQTKHANRIYDILSQRGFAGDTSKPGTGKTYVASAVSKRFNLPVMVFCPKTVMNKWYECLVQFGNQVVTVTNYDMARSSHSDEDVKWFDMRQNYVETATICPWIKKSKRLRNGKEETRFSFQIPYKCFIIFDEEHVGKNVHTQTFAFMDGAMRAAKKQGHKILYASATPIERKEQLKSVLKLLTMIPKADMLVVNKYFKDHIGTDKMEEIHKYLYDDRNGYMSSMQEATIPKGITNDVRAEIYHMNEEITKKIAAKNEENLELRKRLKEKNYDHTLGSINANRKIIEEYKVPKMAEIAEEVLAKGYWVEIFVNYKSSLYELDKILSPNWKVSLLHGDQKKHEEQAAVSNFNEGRTQVLISTIMKGGISLSFHDTVGTRPRYVIISPPTSATNLLQCIGRSFRTNVMSSVIQRIVFVEGDKIEESIKEGLNAKMHDICKFTIGRQNDFQLLDLAMQDNK